MLSRNAALDALDLVDIVNVNDASRTAAKVGLVCTLYVADPHSVAVRARLAECGDRYLQRFGACLSLYQEPDGRGGFRAYPKRGLSLIKLAHKCPPEEPFTPSFTGAKNARDASSYSLEIIAPCTTYFSPGDVAGVMSASMPVSALFDRHAGTSEFEDLVASWCTLLQPVSGLAGIGFIQSIDILERERTTRQLSTLAIRFPGIDFDKPSITAPHISNNIKCINWMTIVSKSLAQSTTNRAIQGQHLHHHSISVKDYGTGIIIRAGASPVFAVSDCQSEAFETYRTVAKTLAPLRLCFPEGDCLLDTGDEDATNLTNRWLARFEGAPLDVNLSDS